MPSPAGRGRGRQSNIDYIKPKEPSFLTKFKQQAGYKEGPNVDTKRVTPNFDEEDDRPEADDEKPTVVILQDGDLTREQVDKHEQGAEKGDAPRQDGKILFKKPAKRTSQEGTSSDLNVSSNKKKKSSSDKRRSEDGKGKKKVVKNVSLLSFGDDGDEN